MHTLRQLFVATIFMAALGMSAGAQAPAGEAGVAARQGEAGPTWSWSSRLSV